MSQQVAIAVDGVSKLYGEFRAVDNLSFEVYDGEVFALLGPNGAGKSTTIRMILDILKPDTGRISVLGGALNEATKDRIGYLPEERGLYRNVPVLEMMMYLGSLKGMKSADARARSLRFLEQLELADYAKKKVSELSKGMQQKVQFAITILHNPDLIIIDEPFSGLDPVNTRLIKSLLLDFASEGHAVVMSTHQMYQVEEMADRLLMISRGKRQLYGSVSAVRQQYAVPAVRVQGTGDWSLLSGVERVEADQNGRDGRQTLFLKPNVTPDSVLGEIAQRDELHITSFDLALPSLDDIFVRVVQGDVPVSPPQAKALEANHV